MTWPRVETATHYGVIGCARPLEDAMRIAFEELIYWMEDDWGIAAPDAYLLLAQVAEARCTQMVNPKYSYICTIQKDILDCYRCASRGCVALSRRSAQPAGSMIS